MADVIAMTDYLPEAYPRMLALARADTAIVTSASQGVRVIRILVDPDEFARWLRKHRLRSDPETRARYAVEIAHKKFAAH